MVLKKKSHLLSHQKELKKKKGIKLPKEAKEFYSETDKTLMKEIKDDTNRWKDTPLSWTGRSNIVKMTILPNVI